MVTFYRTLIKDNKKWIWRASLWALVSFLLGAAVYIFYPDFLSRIMSFLDSVFQNILGQGEPPRRWETVYLIFKNNFTASAIALFFGLVLGIVPLFTIGLNFFILGFLFAFFTLTKNISGYAGILVFLTSVVPHSIFEIPAFLLACAFGLRFGTTWLRFDSASSRGQRFKHSFLDNIKILPLLAILFFLAAIVEVFVSGKLAEMLVK
ncbi:stage II sporulation protein M [bacterium]|nr:MAG: stage II sporulation protein M [bacterium]